MTTMLREIFRRTRAISRARAGTIVAITLTIWLPLELLVSYLSYFVIDPENVWASIRVTTMAENFVGIIATAVIIRLTMASETSGYGASLVDGFCAWGRVFLTRLLSSLLVIVGFVLLVVPGFILIVRLSMAEQVAVCERVPATVAISRSWDLTRGRFWLLVLVGVIYLAILAVLVFLPVFLLPEIDNWLLDAASALVTDIIMAFGTVAFTCVYQILSEPARGEEPLAEAAV